MKKIYLMRHSIAENADMPTEKLHLSEAGIRLALDKKQCCSDIARCYTSPYNRALETAKLIAGEVEVVAGLRERVIGDEEEGFWLRQYQDYDYRSESGESLNQVKLRMKQSLDYIIKNTKDGETALAVSHATAICAYLLNYCEIEVIEPDTKLRRITFENRVILDGKINLADYFILEVESDKITDISFSGGY